MWPFPSYEFDFGLSLLLPQTSKIFHSFQLLYAAMNLTTNEMFNYKRYNYLKNGRGKYHNPYSRGVIYNLAKFFLCVQPVEVEDLPAFELLE